MFSGRTVQETIVSLKGASKHWDVDGIFLMGASKHWDINGIFLKEAREHWDVYEIISRRLANTGI